MDAWLEQASAAVAEAAGIAPAELELDPVAARTVLELARVAAHDSGARTNAPLLCYLVGLAVRSGAADLEALARAVPRSSE